MKKWIRRQGLAVFGVICLLLLLFWFLWVDVLVKRLVESGGTRMVEAKVELDGADLTLFPMGLTLKRLQVTNPEEPMKNAVEVARIACTIDGLNLLRRKIVIQEMSLEGVQLGTARVKSGALPGAKKREPAKETTDRPYSLQIPSLEIPSVEKILQTEELQSLKAIESLRAEMEGEKKNWQKRVSELPNRRKIEEYKNRIEKLRGLTRGGIGEVIRGVSEALALQKEIEGDLDRIKKAQNEFTTKLAYMREQVSKMEKAPLEDMARLKKKYSLTSFDAGAWSRLLLEGKTHALVEKSLFWWKKLQPLLERVKDRKGKAEVVKPLRGKGVDVRFPEHQPLPDFLIRSAKVSLKLHVGDLAGRVENITPDQDVLNRPLTFMFSGEKLQLADQVRLSGVLDHMLPSRSSDQVNLFLQGYPVKDIGFLEKGALPFQLAEAVANLEVQATLKPKSIQGNLAATLASARFQMGKEQETNPLLRAVASGLKNISNFTVQAKVSGPLENYDVQVSSDLGDRIKSAVTSQVQTYASQFEKDLVSSISEKVRGPLQDTKGGLTGLEDFREELETRAQQLVGLHTQATPQKGPAGFKLPF